jgi:hypothetical protein
MAPHYDELKRRPVGEMRPKPSCISKRQRH